MSCELRHEVDVPHAWDGPHPGGPRAAIALRQQTDPTRASEASRRS